MDHDIQLEYIANEGQVIVYLSVRNAGQGILAKFSESMWNEPECRIMIEQLCENFVEKAIKDLGGSVARKGRNDGN